jgi:glutamate racemase
MDKRLTICDFVNTRHRCFSAMSAPPPPHLDHDADQHLGQGYRIGVFDSGVGGLSVLRAIRARLPLAQIVYVADSGHAPYGERDEAYITARCHHIAAFLHQRAVDCIVVACNTATAIAVNSLRAHLPAMPIIGVEPGVKPAVKRSVNKRVGVLATPGTLSSARFKALVQSHGQGADLTLQPCPGLAKEIETGDLDGAAVRSLIAQFSAPLKTAKVDTVVLGCTHYPFVMAAFQQALGPDVFIVDTAEAVARRTASVLHDLPQMAASPCAVDRQAIELWTTGEPEHLTRLARHWLNLDCSAHLLR